MKVFYKTVLPKVFLQTLIQVGPEVTNPQAPASTLCGRPRVLIKRSSI
jgi:hypothetical protein